MELAEQYSNTRRPRISSISVGDEVFIKNLRYLMHSNTMVEQMEGYRVCIASSCISKSCFSECSTGGIYISGFSLEMYSDPRNSIPLCKTTMYDKNERMYKK